MKYLITNADDFGWGEDITLGIIESHLNGILTSASVIINEIDNESLKLIKKVPRLGLGLHLNIATGGKFTHPKRKGNKPYSQKDWEETYGNLETNSVCLEFENQLEKFKNLIGKLPDHIDTHYHTYSVRPVFDAYKKLAKKYSLPVRPPVGYVGDKTQEDFQSRTSELNHMNEFIDELKSENVIMPDYFSLEYINLHEDYIGAIEHELSKIKDSESIEISFHPGLREEWRKVQVKILTDPKLKDWILKNNVELITYGKLAKLNRS